MRAHWGPLVNKFAKPLSSSFGRFHVRHVQTMKLHTVRQFGRLGGGVVLLVWVGCVFFCLFVFFHVVPRVGKLGNYKWLVRQLRSDSFVAV